MMTARTKGNTMDENQFGLKPAAKAYVGAILAALVAGAGTMYTALDDDVISSQETVGIVSAVLGALVVVFGGVWTARNTSR